MDNSDEEEIVVLTECLEELDPLIQKDIQSQNDQILNSKSIQYEIETYKKSARDFLECK